MREFTDSDVIAAVKPGLLLAEVERCLADLGRGEALQMPKAAMPFAPGSFFLSVAGLVPRLGLAASKWASYAPGTDGAAGVSTSRLTVSDSTTGEPLATISGMTATHLRTAATAVAAARRFAVAEPQTIAFLGFGPTNRAVFDFLRAVSPAQPDIRIAVRSESSRARIAESLAGLLSDSPGELASVVVTTDVALAITGADLAFSATGSTSTLGVIDLLAKSAVVVSLDGSGTWAVGADTVVLTDRTVNGAAPTVAAAFARDEVRPAAGQRVLLDIAGSAVTDVALAAILLQNSPGVLA